MKEVFVLLWKPPPGRTSDSWQVIGVYDSYEEANDDGSGCWKVVKTYLKEKN